MASYDTDVVSYSTDMANYGSSGKNGLPGLCSVLPPTSSVGVLCCTVTRTVLSVLSHRLCTTTRTTFSELPQALCWSVIVFSVTRAVISLSPDMLWCHSLLTFDILFPGTITMTKLAFLDLDLDGYVTSHPFNGMMDMNRLNVLLVQCLLLCLMDKDLIKNNFFVITFVDVSW